MACDKTLNLKIDFDDFIFDKLEEGETGEQLRSSALSYFKEIKERMKKDGFPITQEFLDDFSNFALETLTDAGLALKGLNISNVQELILNPTKPLKDLGSLDNTTASLDITVATKKEFRRDFIEKIYDGADIVKQQAVKEIEYNFCKALLFDRDNGSITQNTNQLNLNIKKYQNNLFLTVFEYLKTYYSSNVGKNQIISYDILDNDNLILYNDDFTYTGNFEKLFTVAANLFNTFDKKKLNESLAHNKLALKAFNAFQTLLHFDEFLLNSFGEAITISDMTNRFIDNNKYKLASKATSMFWNNLADDDIDMTKSINNISKLLVTTTRMYDFNTGVLLEDIYLKFNQFISAISKLKDLATLHLVINNIKLNSENSNGYVYNFKEMSDSSLATIRNLGSEATLGTLINKLGNTPNYYFPALFEIFMDQEMRKDSDFKLILKRFNGEEKNVIYSLAKEIYANRGTSLCHTLELSGYGENKADYMSYILQTSDSTWLVKNCLYFQDPETRQVILLTLLNSNVGIEQRRLNDLFNIQNSPKTNLAYKKYDAKYIKLYGFECEVNKNKLHINNTGILTINGKSFRDFMLDLDIDIFNEFLDDLLHLPLNPDSKLFTNFLYVTQSLNKVEALLKLVNFAAELLHGLVAINAINQALANPDSWKDQNNTKSIIELTAAEYYPSEYYGKSKVSFNYRNIDIVPSKLLTTMENIAEARSITNGAYTASQVTDSEGKALGTSTPSRLLSTYEQYFQDIKENVNAPCHDFILITDPNTLLDILTVREYKAIGGDAKTYNQFNTREFLESSFINDFINSIVSTNSNKYNLLNELGVIAITPSVNSDKNTISKMFINVNGLLKRINALQGTKYKNIQEFILDKNAIKYLKLFIDQDLSAYYSTIINKIENDYKTLRPTSTNKGSKTWEQVMGRNFVFKYNASSFNEINKKLAVYNKRISKPLSIRDFYNLISLESGVLINELIHAVFKKNYVGPNHSLQMLYNRYNHNEEELTDNDMPNSEQFWKYKNSELILALVKNECDLSVLSNKDLYKFITDSKLRTNDSKSSWINDSGKLIFGKYHSIDSNGKEIIYNINSELDLLNISENDITISNKLKVIPVKEALLKSQAINPELILTIMSARSIDDLLNIVQVNPQLLAATLDIINDKNLAKVELKNNLHLLASSLELNPLLETYNMLDYLYSLEFILSTVGSHINHPYKKYSIECHDFLSYLEDEAGRYQALHKRNVSFTASMHKFRLNLLNGIPSVYNIACTLDINDLVYSLGGDMDSVKPFDGATFVNPFIVHLENNSLNGEKAGIHKKLFVHFYDLNLGTGGIIKTAGFGLTNSWMRNSSFLQRMMKKMTDFKWTYSYNNTPILIDITQKNQLNRNKSLASNISEYEPVYYKEPININGEWKYNYFKINKIIPIYELNNLGGNSEVFSGKYKLERIRVNVLGNEISPAESIITGIIDSNYKVWRDIFQGLNSVSFNNKGYLSDKSTYGESSIRNTVHAINQCGFLLNGYTKATDLVSYYQPMKHSDTHYWPTEGSVKQGIANYNTKSIYYDSSMGNRYLIEMKLSGIQLDKEHHADNSEISMMTQVISACASLGYSWNESNKLYKALYQLTLLGIKPLMEPLQLVFLTNTDESKNKLLIAVTNLIVKNLANGSSSKDGVLFNIAQLLIDQYRSGKIISLLDIKNNPIPLSDPSTFKKIQSMLSSALTSNSIKLKFKGILSVLVPSHEIMKLYGGKLRSNFINFEEQIKEMLEEFDKNPLEINDIHIGRTYKIYKDGNLLDKVLILAPYMSDEDKNGIYGNPNSKYIGYYELRELLQNDYKGAYLVEDVTEGRNLGAYFCKFKVDSDNKDVNGKYFNFYDLATVKTIYTKGNSKELRILLQKDLVDLKEKGIARLNIDNAIYDVNISDLQIEPYEVIMPKTMATQLGIDEDDDLYTLVNDKQSFTKKLVNNLTNKITDEKAYTLALKRTNGNHIYVLSKNLFDSLNPENLIELETYPPVTDADGSVYRVDSEGNHLYKMHSISDKVYSVDGQEVIVTDNINFYAKNISYNTLYASKYAFVSHNNEDISAFEELINLNTTNLGFSRWKHAVLRGSDTIDLQDALKRNMALGNLKTYNGIDILTLDGKHIDRNLNDYILQLGLELYSSFKKSLDIIAARIPAQSMQSFMPMKIVGYEDFDINTAYVSTHQIWLQGSDYDIDAVSLLTYVIGNDGKFVGWSPLFDYSSEQALAISTELNYPTGNKLIRKNAKDIKGSLVDYLAYISQPFIINDFDIKVSDLQKLVKLVNEMSQRGYIIDIELLSKGELTELVKAFNLKIEDSNPGIKTVKYSELQIITLFTKLEKLINDHNDYINTNPNVESFTKNYVVEQMFRVAMDPRNLLQALKSVDLTTGGPKKIANKSAAEALLKSATPGNIANKYLSIEDNHVGKEVIGISAVGLKAFFGITLYVNTILNLGDAEAITKLLSHPLKFNGLEYHTISNANFKGLNKNLDTNKLNLQILETLLNLDSTNNGNDAALLLSALLSLATDNAKELCLAKLNANADMAGMYIYGLSMGVSFEDLGKLLMSDIGDTVASLLKGSIITDKLGIKTIDQALSYMEDPIKKLRSIMIGMHTWDNYKSDIKDPRINVWSTLATHFLQNFDTKYLDFVKQFKDLPEGSILSLEKFLRYSIEGLEKGSINLEEVIDKIELLRDLSKNVSPAFKDGLKVVNNEKVRAYKAALNKMLINEAIDMLENAILMKYKLINAEESTWKGALQDFINLHLGADEFSTIGSLFGTNLGVKNTDIDYTKFISKFEGIILKRKKAKGSAEDFKLEDVELNFQKFITDSNYQKEKIEAYDKIMFTFNPLHIITMVPHYYGYILTAFVKHGVSLRDSVKYRTRYKYLSKMNRVIGNIKLDQKIKSLDKLIEYKIINSYFNTSINNEGNPGKYFYVPKGFKVIRLKGLLDNRTYHPIAQATRIYLGTLGGNATFKNWVELEVIPNLKKGKTSNNDVYIKQYLINNEFILNLRPNTYTLNPNKNSSISYALNINMSPRNDEDRAIVDRVRLEFDSLGSSYQILLEDGSMFSIPIKDIFFYYNLIAYNGANGESTLTRMFDNYATNPGGESYNFYKSIALLDNSEKTFDISDSEIVNWAALVESPYTSYSNAIYYKNMDKLRMEVLYKAELTEFEDPSMMPATIGSYTANSEKSTLDPNLILHNPSKIDVQTMLITNDSGTFEVTCDPVLRIITEIKNITDPDNPKTAIRDKLITLNKKFKNHVNLLFDYNPEFDLYSLNTEIFNTLINQDLNCNI